MNYKGVLFFDYDGTLTDEKDGVPFPSESCRNALAEAQINGYMVVLNSGRPKCLVTQSGINFDGYVLSNGSYAEVNGKTIFESFIPKDKLKKLIDKLDEMKLGYFVETQAICYSSNPSDSRLSAHRINFNMPESAFTPLDRANIPDTGKLQVVFDTEEQYSQLVDYFSGIFVFDRHRLSKSTDASRFGMTKADGARAICEAFNIDKHEIYAFGDGSNDYDLLKFAYHAAAPKEHYPKLDEVCDFITDSVKNDGIKKALVRYNII